MPTVRELITKLKVEGTSATDKLAKFGLTVNGVKAGLDMPSDVFSLWIKDKTKISRKK